MQRYENHEEAGLFIGYCDDWILFDAGHHSNWKHEGGGDLDDGGGSYNCIHLDPHSVPEPFTFDYGKAVKVRVVVCESRGSLVLGVHSNALCSE